jgi:hypothetical protein
MSVRINSRDPLGGSVLLNLSDLHEMMMRCVRFDSYVFWLPLDGYNICLHLIGRLLLLRPIIFKGITQSRLGRLIGQRELALVAKHLEIILDFKTPALHHFWLLGCGYRAIRFQLFSTHLNELHADLVGRSRPLSLLKYR